MMQNGNKHGVMAAYVIAIILAIAVLLRFSYLSINEGRPRYQDPILSELLVRGSIYDRDGQLLAIQAPDYGFSISLSGSSPSYIASVISRYTTEPAVSLESRIGNGEDFIIIPMIPSITEMNQIRDYLESLGLSDEVQLTTRETRKYPSYQDTWNIIGGVDHTLSGVSGIERIFDDVLSPNPSPYQRIARGKDLTLTIDIEAQEALMEYQKRKGTNGAIALISPSGTIIAWTGGPDEAVLRAMTASVANGYKEGGEPAPLPFAEEMIIDIGDGYRIYEDSPLLSDLAL